MLPLDISAATNASVPSFDTGSDPALDAVFNWFSSQNNLQERFGYVLRQSIDEVLDGQRTGRFDIKFLEKTEKTYLGTKVEIITRAEFNLSRGTSMDYSVAGNDVDAKFTILKNWTIPHEADGHICLLMRANDYESKFQVGLLRIRNEFLNVGRNRDGKRTPSAVGRSAIRWIIPDGKLPENILMSLPESDRNAIFHASDGYRGGGNGGQLRTDELFRRARNKLIDRNTVLTVASQDDGPKRVRDARNRLRGEGIMILGAQDQHPHIARALGLTAPHKGSWMAVRVTNLGPNAGTRRTAEVMGNRYGLWTEGDPHTPAPASY
ncbi:NaeI family type II restriction endonuclease [Streptomyces sp. NPDC006649]|uniref:NaeI family type II restriction endonuclease n=1 Tax=Streptomyces sp. NPDC006649 TaxID=3156896 RepID=UPI0033A9FB71